MFRSHSQKSYERAIALFKNTTAVSYLLYQIELIEEVGECNLRGFYFPIEHKAFPLLKQLLRNALEDNFPEKEIMDKPIEGLSYPATVEEIIFDSLINRAYLPISIFKSRVPQECTLSEETLLAMLKEHFKQEVEKALTCDQ